MVIGVLSDIHGNLEALEAVLGFFQNKGVQAVLCGGDIVGYGPDPEACIERVQRLNARTVAGNHDWAVLGRTDIRSFNPLAAQAVLWTRDRLKQAHQRYLEGLPLVFHFGPINLAHTAPTDPASWDYILTLQDAAAEMGGFVEDIGIIGHTHIPMAVERISGGPTRLIEKNYFFLRDDARYLINAGSVGQPRDGDPRACCLLMDTNERWVAFHRVEYDIFRTQEKMRRAGLPEPLIERLSKGV